MTKEFEFTDQWLKGSLQEGEGKHSQFKEFELLIRVTLWLGFTIYHCRGLDKI